MLNRFKNVLYGTSDLGDDTILEQHSGKKSLRRDIVGDKLRNRLTRSSSFRDDLLRDLGGGNNDNTHHDRQPRSRLFNSVLGSSSGNSQYSSHPGRDFSSTESSIDRSQKLPKFPYSRPEFLQLRSDDEILVSADHEIRPIILPRDAMKLPMKSGYAECINSGKSLRNEDQAAIYQDVLIRRSSRIPLSDAVTIDDQLPWTYFGLFDGHAGDAVAVAASNQLHKIVALKLQQVADILIALEFEAEDDICDSDDDFDTDDQEEAETSLNNPVVITSENPKAENNSQGVPTEPQDNLFVSQNPKIIVESPGDGNDKKENDSPAYTAMEKDPEKQSTREKLEEDSPIEKRSPKRKYYKKFDHDLGINYTLKLCNLSVDSLVKGALESAFWDMDQLIERDKANYHMPGGCTAIVAVFILGRLYVSNAGDSRAIIYKNRAVIPMSFDFTPTSERKRVLRLGQQRPELMGNDFTHLEYLQKPTRADIGKMMLYRDAYMTGWSLKQITHNDLKFPLVWGEGKRSRVLATIGVTRGFGDHELKAQNGPLYIKPFLTAEPEVRILNLEDDRSLTADDVLIMGTDGLWDVTSNEEAAEIVEKSFVLSPNDGSRSKYRYMSAAQDLIIHSRGLTTNRRRIWKLDDERLASMDDIAVFVIPIKQYRDDYVNWKQMRDLSRQNNEERKSLQE